MEGDDSSDPLVMVYQAKRRRNVGNSNFHNHRR
jgi:hypothetical protein